MRRTLVVLASLALLSTLLSAAATGQEGGAPPGQVPEEVASQVAAGKADQVYIVLMDGDPLATYEGDIPGLAATAPDEGERLDAAAPEAEAYSDFLERKHDGTLASVAPVSQKIYGYTASLDGFAAVLSPAQAEALAERPGVMAVMPDFEKSVETNRTPDFLRLSREAIADLKGEDVVIGVIDQGVWPEHASYADFPESFGVVPLPHDDDDDDHDDLDLAELAELEASIAHDDDDHDDHDDHGDLRKQIRAARYGDAPEHFVGEGCQFGNTAFNPDDAPFECQDKLLAAKYYADGFLAGNSLADGSFLSARDENGHGTHTSTTAGGNAYVPATLFDQDLGRVSGIAPRARLSIYKACWNSTPSAGGCNGSDLVKAIDDAVADGVDVINYSIGSNSPLLQADDLAFLSALDAGVFVATSAGNTGPGASSVNSPATVPWVMSVGASTKDRDFTARVVLGDGTRLTGASVTQGTDGRLPLVDAAAAGDELCNPGALDPGVVEGKVVLCLRGAIARVAKSLAVSQAGGAGMILYNASDTQTENTDNHHVPSAHISNTDGLVVKNYIATTADPTARIRDSRQVRSQGSVMADFSSRGPNLYSLDIIKPDVTAPGVNILAGGTPADILAAPGQLFQAISGTSMSSPHVAGAAARLVEAYPDWSPSAIKSALMTSARQNVTKEDATTLADPFDMGAGHIRPHRAVNPGVVYEAGFVEYLGFLCDASPEVFADPAATCAALASAGVPTTAENLNYPSIAVSQVAGTSTVQRTVTSVADRTRTFRARVEAPPGFTVSVSPDRLRLAPGESADYQVTFTRSGAPLDQWQFGSLTWRGGGSQARSPIAVKPVVLGSPQEVLGTGTTGSLSYDVQFGYDGTFDLGTHGLVAAAETPGNVVDDPTNDINQALASGVGITTVPINVPGDTGLLRVALLDEFTDGADDLDLYLFGPGGVFVALSGGGTSAEQIDVVLPAPGDYLLIVHGWETEGPDANFTLFSWVVGPDQGNMTVTGPDTAVVGQTGTIDVAWTDLDAGASPVPYLGAVSYNDGGGIFGLTAVSVDASG